MGTEVQHTFYVLFICKVFFFRVSKVILSKLFDKRMNLTPVQPFCTKCFNEGQTNKASLI